MYYLLNPLASLQSLTTQTHKTAQKKSSSTILCDNAKLHFSTTRSESAARSLFRDSKFESTHGATPVGTVGVGSESGLKM